MYNVIYNNIRNYRNGAEFVFYDCVRKLRRTLQLYNIIWYTMRWYTSTRMVIIYMLCRYSIIYSNYVLHLYYFLIPLQSGCRESRKLHNYTTRYLYVYIMLLSRCNIIIVLFAGFYGVYAPASPQFHVGISI